MRAWTILMLPLAAGACRGGALDDGSPKDTDTADADTDADTDSDTDADTDADTDSDTDVDVSACLEGPDPSGPWPEHPITEAGATVTNAPYAFSAGLGAVRDAAVGNIDPVEVDLEVTGAIVTAVDFVPATNSGWATFWVEDGDAAMMVYQGALGGFDPTLLAPGDEVSFTVTTVKDQFGTPEIAGDAFASPIVPGLTNFQVLSSGNPVHVIDGNAGLTTDDVSYVAEFWGGLAGGGDGCGGDYVCFDYETPGGTIVYRTESTYEQVGDCEHYIGPVSQFDGAVQANVLNFDWSFRF